jgi:hypothetical protein
MTGAISVFIEYAVPKPVWKGKNCGPSDSFLCYPSLSWFR